MNVRNHGHLQIRTRLPGSCLAVALAVLALSGRTAVGAESLTSQAQPATRIKMPELVPARAFAVADTDLICFDGRLNEPISPACFLVGTPPTSSNCISHSRFFLVQYLFPGFSTDQRVRGFAFIGNDGSTLFPSAGIIMIPVPDLRFPTPAELANLQVHNVVTPHDTAVVVVDLQAANLIVHPNTAVVLCLQFPEGGKLTDVGVGPGILANNTPPDQTCDYFTLNSGQPDSWYVPDHNDPNPLDWGFLLVLDTVSVAPTSWTRVKGLYHSP